MNEMIDLRKTKNNLVHHLQEMIEQIQNAEIQSLTIEENITTFQIKNESFVRQFAEKLPKTGSHIYWFNVDKPNELVKQFNEKSIDSKYKVARDNKNAESEYVYVGSCTKIKLGDRFKQHCGYGHHSTYSLQLSKWIGDDELTFTFAYVEMPDALIAQQLEDQLHRELKPIFGKSGGNNKIKAAK